MRTTLVVGMLAVAACSSSLHAQLQSPGYYGLPAAADAVPVLAAPDTGAQPIATLIPGTQPIEVVEVREALGLRWGMVAAGEQAGWVPMDRLEPVEPAGVLGTAVPGAASCGGTEPFWGLSFEGDLALFHDPFFEPHETRLPIDSAVAASGRFSPVLLSFSQRRGHAVLEQRACFDGMSDIPHGWSLQLILTGTAPEDEPRLLSGCCRVLP